MKEFLSFLLVLHNCSLELCMDQAEAKSRNSSLMSHRGIRDQSTWAIIFCFPGQTLPGSWSRSTSKPPSKAEPCALLAFQAVAYLLCHKTCFKYLLDLQHCGNRTSVTVTESSGLLLNIHNWAGAPKLLKNLQVYYCSGIIMKK